MAKWQLRLNGGNLQAMRLIQNLAIVFNCHYNGLSIIQDLGRRGVPCVAMDSRRSVGSMSRYARFVLCPDPGQDESGFIDFLYEYCTKLDAKPVLFPTNDHWAMAVARHKDRLSEVALPCASDWPAMQRVIEKDKFYLLGQERGYGTPRTFDLKDLNRLSLDSYPIAAKPKHRRISADKDPGEYHRAMDRLRLTVLNGPGELERFLRREERWLADLVFQQYVPGLSDQMRTIGVYADQDSVAKAVFTGRKVRGYPYDIGDCVVGETTYLPKALVDHALAIASELRLSGILEFEYKLDPSKDQYFLIEVNPRSWSWVGITSVVGVSLPWAAYCDLTGLSGAPVATQGSSRVDVPARYVRVVEDGINCLLRYRADYRDWSMDPREWWADLRLGKRVLYAEFQRDDPFVALYALWNGLGIVGSWLIGQIAPSAMHKLWDRARSGRSMTGRR